MSSEQKTVQLPPEMWMQVLRFLRQPRPPPNGRNDAGEVRQPHLARAACVSKMFHNIISPLLYTDIVSTDFPILLYGIGAPSAASGIKSKRELLASCKHLFLEYSPKTDPTYPSLMKHGKEQYSLYSPNKAAIMRQCLSECDDITAGTNRLRPILTKLSTLATGAYLGGQQDVWDRFNEDDQSLHQARMRIVTAIKALTTIADMAHVDYFCQRVPHGPLSYAPVMWAETSKGERPLQYRAHLHVASDLPILAGGSARWYETVEDTLLEAAAGRIGEATSLHILQRQDNWKSFEQNRNLPAAWHDNAALQVDLYVDCPAIKNAKDLEVVRARVAEANQDEYDELPRAQKSMCKGDRWRVNRMEGAPTCEACGWMPQDS